MVSTMLHQGFWMFVLYATFMLASIEMLIFTLGFLIAIPTDYGRYFAKFFGSFFGGLYICAVICFFPIKVLMFFKRISDMLEWQYQEINRHGR